MRTKDGQVIPVQITTTNGTELSTAPLELPVTQELPVAEEPLSTLEFITDNGRKYKIIPPYISDTPIDPEYLNIN